MKIVILIAIVDSLALIFWLLYSHFRHTRSDVTARSMRSAGISSEIGLKPKPDKAETAHWTFINSWKVDSQRNDRQPMSGAVAVMGASPSAGRSFARQSHQLRYKKWSQERHD